MNHSKSSRWARTKIVATIGPACARREQLAELVVAGVDLFRLNLAHGTRKEHAAAVAAVRQVSEELEQPIAVLVDLAGPKIRLGELPGGELDCKIGDVLSFVHGERTRRPGELTTTYEPLIEELDVGDSVMLADGAVALVVEEKAKDAVRCRVAQAGTIRNRQGVNLPGVQLSVPAINQVDRDNAVWAAGMEVDFIGLSFVRRAEDVRELRNILHDAGAAAKVVAKIEKQEALDALEDIVRAADAVMVARGDLGVEIDVARMPIVQKHIIETCQRLQKPVIVATQMLESMQRSRRPTRAEVTDVANAILDGGDACMLSGETAVGQFPREAVEIMNQVALAAEELYREGDRARISPNIALADGLRPATAAVVDGAGYIARRLKAKLIVVASHSGATAVALAKQRNYTPTVGVSDVPATLRQMCLVWGVIPLAGAPTEASDALLDFVTDWGRRDGCVAAGDRIVLISGTRMLSGSHNAVSVHEVQ